MNIFPAIDIIDGKVVRLLNGDYGAVTDYAVTPENAARTFKACGATHIHAVDLDGAKRGVAVNTDTVKRIIAATDAFVEIGGGVRTFEQIDEYLSAGARRVILGTAAVKDPVFTERAVKEFGNAIAVGVDAKCGRVAVSGWCEVTELDAFEFCKRLDALGVKTIIYTDISRDGTMRGTNIQAYKKLVGLNADIVASGGIASIEEMVELKNIGVSAAILGKALYENKIDLSRAVAAAKE